MTVRVRPLANSSEVTVVRQLFEEYAVALPFDLAFQGFSAELEGLPGDYVPPQGGLLLAFKDDEAAGCVGLRRLQGGICEMKRLYVRPRFRGANVGRHLAEAVIQMARRLGYQCMRLDTVPFMHAAQGLYYSLGFKPIAPYRPNPIKGASFMELRL